jgi:hypothetical protein
MKTFVLVQPLSDLIFSFATWFFLARYLLTSQRPAFNLCSKSFSVSLFAIFCAGLGVATRFPKLISAPGADLLFLPVSFSSRWILVAVVIGCVHKSIQAIQWSQPRFFALPLNFSGNLISVRKACIFSVGACLSVISGGVSACCFCVWIFTVSFAQVLVLGHGSSFPSLICLSAAILFVHPAAAVSLLAGNFQDRAKGLAQDPVQGLLGSFDLHIPDVQFQSSVRLLSWISARALR